VVVDLTDQIHIGTYTGLYYLFSTLAAIAGPNINGLIIKLAGNNYASIFIIGPIFMLAAFIMVFGMKTKEPGKKPSATPLKTVSGTTPQE
jgi:MFS family permease